MNYEKMPTDPEEVKALEAEYLSPKKEDVSRRRAMTMNENEKRMGFPGSIVRVESKASTETDPNYRDIFVGELAGHKVEITVMGITKKEGERNVREKKGVSVVVWGKGENKDNKIELPQEEAEHLWIKISDALLLTEEEIKSDISEIDEEQKKFLFNEILGEAKKDFGV